MAKFRHRPLMIEAVQWDPDENGTPKNAWPLDWPVKEQEWELESQWSVGGSNRDLIIHTSEGEMLAKPKDWIIRDRRAKGEFYPCKPGIFRATYEPAE